MFEYIKIKGNLTNRIYLHIFKWNESILNPYIVILDIFKVTS